MIGCLTATNCREHLTNMSISCEFIDYLVHSINIRPIYKEPSTKMQYQCLWENCAFKNLFWSFQINFKLPSIRTLKTFLDISKSLHNNLYHLHLNKRQTSPSPNWHFEHLGMRAKKLDHPTIFIQIQETSWNSFDP